MAIPLIDVLKLVGSLDDTPGEDTARSRFRAYLQVNVSKPGVLRDYIGSCCGNSGDQYNRALQDLINRAGELLGFKVDYGRYKGVIGEIGHDGLWSSPAGLFVVAEVKTTDAFSIDTATLLGYVDKLISGKKITDREHALGLYIIARPDHDLAQLENSIVAEKHIDRLRLISAESLLKLTEIACEYGIEHEKLLMLIRPSGPRLDSVIDLMAELIAQEKQEPKIPPSEPREPSTGTLTARQPKIPSAPANDQVGVAQYFLVPVGADEDETAAQVVQRTVSNKWFAFGDRTPHRGSMRAGDWLCFHASGIGTVAAARIVEPARKKEQHPDLKHPQTYPWVVDLDQVNLRLDSPIVIDSEIRAQLDKFKGKNPNAAWGWFVQAVGKLTQHDFLLLTTRSEPESK